MTFLFGAALILFLNLGCQSSHQTADKMIEKRCPSDMGSTCQELVMEKRQDPEIKFTTRFDQIQDSGKNPQAADFLTRVSADKNRALLLQLQAILKVYEHAELSKSDRKDYEQLREQVKELEDQIGDYNRYLSLNAKIEKTSASAQIKKIVKARADKATKETKKFFADETFADRLDEMSEMASELPFLKKKKDQAQQFEGLMELIEEMRDRTLDLDSYISKSHYEHEDLENGPHEWRRDVRWVLAAIHSLDGMFYYPAKKAASAFEKEIGSSPYLYIAPATKGAVELNREVMLQLTKIVMELGELKDFKEGQLDLTELLLENKIYKSRTEAEAFAKTIMIEIYGDLKVEKTVQKFYAQYVKNDPLQKLRKDLQTKWNEK